MVGTVVFKNFETGSYKNIRLVAYDGSSYSHIGKGKFFSCLVDVDNKCIVYDENASAGGPTRAMTTVLLIAQKAREFLYENPYVTVAEYVLNGSECSFRSVSVKCGVYQVPDFANVFSKGAFYKLISQKQDKSFLWCSTLCELMNFAFQRVFSSSEWVYSHAGYGIYFNISCLSFKVLKSMHFPFKTLLNILGKTSHKVNLKKVCGKIELMQHTARLHPYTKLIVSASDAKLRSAQRLVSLVCGKKGALDIWDVLSRFPDDEYMISLTDSLVKELSEYGTNYWEWGYFNAMSHKDCITLREFFALSVDGEITKTISKTASARSVNHKFLKKLPCPEYIDSDGSVVNINKGEIKT